MREHCIEEYRNWYEIDGSRNKWGQMHAASAVCDSLLQAAGMHALAKRREVPAPLHRLCFPTSSIKKRLSQKFGTLCPVRYASLFSIIPYEMREGVQMNTSIAMTCFFFLGGPSRYLFIKVCLFSLLQFLSEPL